MTKKVRMKKKMRPEKRRNRRAVFVGLILSACILGLFYRIYYYKTVWGDEYTMLAVQQEARRYISRVSNEVSPIRGQITDRNMNPIVSSRQMFTVFLDVIELQRRHDRNLRDVSRHIRDEVFEIILSTFPDIRRSDLLDRFELNADGNLVRPTNHYVLAREVSPEVAMWITSQVPEIHATQESVRFFDRPDFAPQVVGFIRGDTSWGLERHFDRQLAGEPGRTVWVQGEVEELPVRDGYTIVTTLDPEIQRLAQRYVDNTYAEHPSEYVGIIVMNPNTGEIYAMAQAPTFSLAAPMEREFITHRQLLEDWDDLTNQEIAAEMNFVWRNYHITWSGEPGSTFKPMVIAAAIEEGVLSPDAHFYCEGYRDIFDQTVWCWNEWGHGSMNLREALAFSCNVAMIDINQMLGANVFYRYRGYFGFGEFTGIDLPAEMDVSDPSVMYTLHRLQAVEMATSSIGQGFNTTTMQSINAIAALINGGELLRPFVVSRIIDQSGNVVSETLRHVERRVISQHTSDFIRREMQYVFTYDAGVNRRGTGLQANLPGYSMGGKTGTAQQGPREDGRNTLSFVVYTPVENPDIVMLIIIDSIKEQGRHVTSGTILAPVVRRFMTDLIAIRHIPPIDGTIVDSGAQEAIMLMPDFSGQRLADIVPSLNIVNPGGYHVTGRGTIIQSTIPLPGQPMPQNSPVFFTMDPNSVVAPAMVSVPNVVGLTLSSATQFFEDVGLRVATARSERPTPVEGEFYPNTARPTQREEDESTTQQADMFVYRQFPAPGTEIERGTEVLLRIRE